MHLFGGLGQKPHLDVSLNYQWSKYFGANLGYKRIETHSNVQIVGDSSYSQAISFDGVIAGLSGVVRVSRTSTAHAVLGYGFLSAGSFSTSSGETVDLSSADGISWELGWNLSLSNSWVLSIAYKLQDFKYDRTDLLNEPVVFNTQDKTAGPIAGLRYYF